MTSSLHRTAARVNAVLLTTFFVFHCHAQTAAPDRLARAFVRQPHHTARAYSVAFTRDGRTLASGSWDGAVKLWDVKSGRERRTLAGHGHGIYRVAFSPDGRRLASASRDGTVRVWDVSSGRTLHTLTADSLAVKALDWSPDGRLLASGGNDGVVKLWDASAGREARSLRHAWREGGAGIVISLAFSADSRTLAARNWDGTLSLWDVAAGREAVIETVSPNAPTSSIALSPDGRLVAAADEDSKIKFWETSTGRLVRTLDDPPAAGFARQIVSLAFSPDGRTLAAGEARVENAKARYDGWIKLWDLESGRVRREAWAHVMEPDMLAFAPGGRLLASGGADGAVKLWDAELKESKTLSVGPLAARGLKAAPFDLPNPELMLPQTPAGLRMLEWLGAFNTGNVYLMRGFAAQRFAPSALARAAADDRALADLELYRQQGELELGVVERAAATEIVVLARSPRTLGWQRIRLRIEDTEPHGVTLFERLDLPAPPRPATKP